MVARKIKIYPTVKHILLSLNFLVILLMFPASGNGQNYPLQDILFKNSLDSVKLNWEYGSDTINGNKTLKINKIKRPIQFIAEKKGYKAQYFALVNNIYDVYKNEVDVKFDRKIPYFAKGKKHIYLRNFEVPLESAEMEQLLAENEDFGAQDKKLYNLGDFKSNMIHIDEKTGGDYINEFLEEWGYVDTTGRLLRSNTSETSAEVSIKKSKYYVSIIKKGSKFDYRMVCEITVEWKFYDEYNVLKLTEELTTKSGQFAAMYLPNGRIENPYEVCERASEDALSNSFIDLLNSEKGNAWISDSYDSEKQAKLEQLKFKKTINPVELKTALKSTFPVITEKGFGSGFVVSTDGYILTNYHVIAGQDSSIKILVSEKDSVPARIVRVSEKGDLAVLKCDRIFPMAILLDPSVEISLADEVYAIGTPLSIELGQTVSKGIVSGIRKNDSGLNIIQTDVSVNPGNSGGPLLSAEGKLVGVVSAKVFGRGIEGLGFGIAIGDVMKELKIGY